MGHIRTRKYPSTETFLAAKVNNMELKWKDVLEAILSIGEYQLADRVCSDRGWLLSRLSALECQLQVCSNGPCYQYQRRLDTLDLFWLL